MKKIKMNYDGARRWHEKLTGRSMKSLLMEKTDRNSQLCCVAAKTSHQNSECLDWWQKAAEQGDADAQNSLGALYANGQGVPRDDAIAQGWWRKAAEQENENALTNLETIRLKPDPEETPSNLRGSLLVVPLFLIMLALISGGASAHPGGKNAEGCHAGSQPYHCHTPGGGDSEKEKPSGRIKKNEAFYNKLYCQSIEGRREARHQYTHPTGASHVYVDCETADKVIEGGLDKRSSLDSVQQALFFAYLTGKKPVVVIYDTDGKIGSFKYRIEQACALAGVEFIRVEARRWK